LRLGNLPRPRDWKPLLKIDDRQLCLKKAHGYDDAEEMPHLQGQKAASLLFSRLTGLADGMVKRSFTGDFVMLTALWLMLGALVGAKVVLWRRNRRERNEFPLALERQIYRLHHLAAMAKEDETFRELRAMARGER